MCAHDENMRLLSGVGWAVVECQGGREHMEDFHVMSSFSGPHEVCVFGVFDGHGGASVAEHCSRHMATCVAQGHFGPQQQQQPIEARLTAAFHAVDDGAAQDVRSRSAGSTACVALVTPTDVWVANAGDSRAFVRARGRQLVEMSEDHKPSTARERARILQGGGVISYASGMARVGGLNLSRSIGDLHARPHVVCTPDVRRWPRTCDAYLIIASDGVWDVLDNAMVAGIVEGAHQSAGASLQEVVRQARMLGSRDNITIMYVAL